MFTFDKPSLLQCPTGRWKFVGLVPAVLSYVQQNGDTPTPKQFQAAVQCGPGIVGLRSRTWETEAEAQAALDAYLADQYKNRPIDL